MRWEIQPRDPGFYRIPQILSGTSLLAPSRHQGGVLRGAKVTQFREQPFFS
jgi:hypothetical protein